MSFSVVKTVAQAVLCVTRISRFGGSQTPHLDDLGHRRASLLGRLPPSCLKLNAKTTGPTGPTRRLNSARQFRQLCNS
ncbi:unnamed protein product [Ixodes persulcatus]